MDQELDFRIHLEVRSAGGHGVEPGEALTLSRNRLPRVGKLQPQGGALQNFGAG